jgi:murein DD-endopeptidase MepM/ murein hydrolase activator NlpD
MNTLKKVTMSVSLLALATACGAAPESDSDVEQHDGSGTLGSASQAVTHSCNSVTTDLWTHEWEGRAYGCTWFDWCGTGSNQIVGNIFDGNVTLSETNPGYWIRGSCLPATSFRWPLGGTNGTNWVIQNYLDRNTAAGAVLDYRNGPKSYDGHNGIDIATANFRQQDAGVNITAAAAGVVETIVDNFPDRGTSFPAGCGNSQNFVQIRHANGSRARYYHIRTNSARTRISQGQSVAQGTVIAQVGSSGCSTNPHLHLEVREFAAVPSGNVNDGFLAGNLLDPFFENMIISPPPYSRVLTLMDAALLAGDQSGNWARLVDPGNNAGTISRNTRFTMVAYTANAIAGDRLNLRVVRPNGTEFWSTGDVVMTGNETRVHWAWWVQTDFTVPTGAWSIQYRVNGTTVRTINFTMI